MRQHHVARLEVGVERQGVKHTPRVPPTRRKSAATSRRRPLHAARHGAVEQRAAQQEARGYEASVSISAQVSQPSSATEASPPASQSARKRAVV